MRKAQQLEARARVSLPQAARTADRMWLETGARPLPRLRGRRPASNPLGGARRPILSPRFPPRFSRGMDCFRDGHDAPLIPAAPAHSTEGRRQRAGQGPSGEDPHSGEEDHSADDGSSSTADLSSSEDIRASLQLAERAERAVLEMRRPQPSGDLSIEVGEASPRCMRDVEYRLQKDSWMLVSRFFMEQLNPPAFAIVKAMTQ